jgi:hypothetical protein
MSDLLKDCTKSVLEKMNLFVVLQIVWIIEFHILAIFSAKDLICSVTEAKIKEPPIIEEYSQMIANWMEAYNEYIFIIAIILIIVGMSGAFFKLIPVLSKYKIVYAYSDFGLYAGCWLFLTIFTYDTYICMGKAFLIAPVIAYILYLLVKKIKVWLESKGITFGE